MKPWAALGPLLYSAPMKRTRSRPTRRPRTSAAHRLFESERLFLDFKELTPYPFRPLARSFASFRECELWRRAQKSPWYR